MARTDLEQFGKVGEQWVARELRRRGYTFELIGESSDYDGILEGVATVEVKSAFVSHRTGKRGPRGRWQFSLRRHGRAVDEDVLFLLCFQDLEHDPVGVFIIPGTSVPIDLCKIDITSEDPRRYRGKWAKWRGCWDAIDMILLVTSWRQGDLMRCILNDTAELGKPLRPRYLRQCIDEKVPF